jgi:carbonic anhydrase/acetyltransferase-like protein (isoleucine patch superfamily)
MPGMLEDFRYSLLPFWGNHCLVDFMVANFPANPDRRIFPLRGLSGNGRGNGGRGSGQTETELTIILEEAHRTVPLTLSSRWKKPVARVLALEDPLAELVALAESSRSENVVLASLSCVCVLDTDALLASVAGAAGRIIKVSASRTPIEMYAGSRQAITSLLQSAVTRRTDRKPLRDCLFAQTLLPSIDTIEEVPGDVLFQSSLMEYFRSNLWVIDNCAEESYRRVLSRLPELADKGVESHIAEKGCIRNSWLASGVEVEGEVEDSIIFPNVHVRRNTRVSRSVILNGNRIGSGAEIQNSLVMTFSAEIARTATNIGDDCSIGSRSSVMKNAAFPEQIRDGLTVVGMNAEVPAGLRIEAGACIEAGVPSSVLRKMKVVKRGTSVFKPATSDAQPAEGAQKGRR